MFKPVRLLVVLSFTALYAEPAAVASIAGESGYATGRQCFRASSVSRFLPGPPGFVVVQSDANRWFQLHLGRGCPDFRRIMQIGIRPKNSQWLCEGQADELGGFPADEGGGCFVDTIRRLPPGALPGQF